MARRNEGLTADNPSVGCLLERDDQVIATGVTALGGRPHAEAIALQRAGDAARGATAYVTLEPCAHHGRTPPCADALVRAGVRRVVAATRDPFKRVDGRGFARLREAGVEVAIADGALADEARDAIAGFLSAVERGRPHVLLKLAVSAEGYLGRAGERVAITGTAAFRRTHLMRARCDAILVGVGTVLADDPSLTCRLPGMGDRSPRRIVLDPRARTPSDSQLARSSRAISTRILVAPDAPADRCKRLGLQGCTVTPLDVGADGRFDRRAVLDVLNRFAIQTVMIEGGAQVARAFLDAGVVDEIALFEGRAIGDDPSTAPPVASPLRATEVPPGFRVARTLALGADRLTLLRR